MKKILLLLLISSSCFAQSDSAALRLDEHKKALNFMADQLQNSHEEFKIGMICTAVGAAAIGGGLLWQSDTSAVNGRKVNRGASVVIITGGVLELLGAVLMIDSHKFIGRAGAWRFTGDKFTVYF